MIGSIYELQENIFFRKVQVKMIIAVKFCNKSKMCFYNDNLTIT